MAAECSIFEIKSQAEQQQQPHKKYRLFTSATTTL